MRYAVDGDAEGAICSAWRFPLPEGRAMRLHLASAGRDAVVHRLGTRVGNGTNAWAAVPFGAVVPPGLSEAANPVLVFDTAASEQEVEYAGPVSLSLRFSCWEIDSHVVARVGRADVDGGYHQLSFGTLRPALRRIDGTRGSACEIAIDIVHRN